MLGHFSNPYQSYLPSSYYGYRHPGYSSDYLRAVAEAQAARERRERLIAAERERQRQRQLREAYDQRTYWEQLAEELGRPRRYNREVSPVGFDHRPNGRGVSPQPGNLEVEREVDTFGPMQRAGVSSRRSSPFGQRRPDTAVERDRVEQNRSSDDEEKIPDVPSTSTQPAVTNAEDETEQSDTSESCEMDDSSTSPSDDVAASLKAISEVENTLQTLQSSFIFPETLDFDTTSPSPTLSAYSNGSTLSLRGLMFTPTNAPLRQFEHSLSGLLTALDGVESHGSDEVRRRRKAVVGKIEDALEELERGVELRFAAKKEEEAKKDEEVKKEEEAENVEEEEAEKDEVAKKDEEVKEDEEVKKGGEAEKEEEEEVEKDGELKKEEEAEEEGVVEKREEGANDDEDCGETMQISSTPSGGENMGESAEMVEETTTMVEEAKTMEEEETTGEGNDQDMTDEAVEEKMVVSDDEEGWTSLGELF